MLEQMAERIARRLANFNGDGSSYLVTSMTAVILDELELDLAHLVAFAAMIGEMHGDELNCCVADPGDHLSIRKRWHNLVSDEPDGPDAIIEARQILDLFYTTPDPES